MIEIELEEYGRLQKKAFLFDALTGIVRQMLPESNDETK